MRSQLIGRWTGWIVLMLLLVWAAIVSAADRPPNVVFIFTDDQGYGDLGCFGNDKLHTPNIDRMAAEGAKLTSFYAAPLCTPAGRR